MGVITKIGLNSVEMSMNKIIETSTKISFLQEELMHLKNQLDDNDYFFSSGLISRQTYDGNRRNFKKKRIQVIKEINQDIRSLSKLSTSVQRNLKTNKL